MEATSRNAPAASPGSFRGYFLVVLRISAILCNEKRETRGKASDSAGAGAEPPIAAQEQGGLGPPGTPPDSFPHRFFESG